MIEIISTIMVFAGSALMVYNIYRYVLFERDLISRGGWDQERRLLIVPIILLVLFLIGYLMVGVLGSPDLVIGCILLGGSVFVLLMIIFLKLVTNRVLENENVRMQLQAAEEANRAKSSFLAVMSHEMRTPLNAIIGLDHMALKDPDLSPDTRDKLEKLESSAQHLMTLINDVLDMNRIASGAMTLSENRFSMHSLLEETNVMIKNQCDEKGLEYRFVVGNDVEGYYLGDEMKLKQVFVNILGNAVKFTFPPGVITFKIEQIASFKDHRTLRFTFRDTGVGMDEEFLPNIFSAFTQEDTSNTSRYGGSGLGMAITKNLVDAMNGEIDVTSKKGVGTTFVVTLSLTKCADEDAKAMEDAIEANGAFAGETVPLEGLHVLMAEDVDLNAEILADLLELEDITSDRAEDGQRAVEMFAQSDMGTYDAVLMDVRMPVMDGLTAAREIRALDRKDARIVPIIAMTANAFAEDEQRSLQAGMNAHLSKPVDPDLLYETLGKHVTESRLRSLKS